jgi:hypothetical protein
MANKLIGNTSKKVWELVLMSDLVKVGVTEEEGHDIIRELWYVVAVDASGRRFRHNANLEKHEAEERLALFILDGGIDGEASWDEMYPVYGSSAYVDQQPEMVAAEKREVLESETWKRARLASLGVRPDGSPIRRQA